MWGLIRRLLLGATACRAKLRRIFGWARPFSQTCICACLAFICVFVIPISSVLLAVSLRGIDAWASDAHEASVRMDGAVWGILIGCCLWGLIYRPGLMYIVWPLQSFFDLAVVGQGHEKICTVLTIRAGHWHKFHDSINIFFTLTRNLFVWIHIRMTGFQRWNFAEKL